MTRKEDLQFLADGLAAFHAMREEGARNLGALWARFERTVLEGPPAPFNPPPRRAVSQGAGRIHRVLRWWRLSARTDARLRLLRARARTGPDLVLAINSARLREPSAGPDPRNHLANLLRELPGSAHGGGLPKDEIAGAGLILIFDPRFESDYAEFADSFAAAGICILDVGSLLFLSRFDLAVAAWKYLRNRQRLKSFGLAAGLMLVLLSRTYDRLLVGRTHTAFFLTSNSFATEILRLCLLRSSGEHRICEILHGIPSQEVTRYFVQLDRLSGPRMRFVPQIPGLDLPASYRPWIPAAPGLAINTYVNRHFAALPKDLPPERWVLEEWSKLTASTPAVRIALAFVGANSLETDFERSAAFAVEKALISFACERLTAAGHPFLLVYAPHPRHDPARLAQDPLFARLGVVLHPNTIFTWIVADCCVSLFSSGLFEAAYLGLPTFSPLLSSDQLFDPALLDLLHHPSDSTRPHLFGSLEALLRTVANRPRADIPTRARSRLKLLAATP